MIQVIRRMLLLVSLMFWQGGFMFYGGVVVPVGARILGSEREQGFITQSVTNYLNLAGAVCLILFLEQLWHDRRHGVSKAGVGPLELRRCFARCARGDPSTDGPDRERRNVEHFRSGPVWPLFTKCTSGRARFSGLRAWPCCSWP